MISTVWQSTVVFYVGTSTSAIMLLMIAACIAALVIAAILVLSELVWKKFGFQEELARKLVHITTGTFIAFLPFWVDYNWIKILALGFIVVNCINHFARIFPSILSVRRKSMGDILFGVGVLAVALFEPPAWLFAVSVLQVAISDGLAAVAGVTYGKKSGRYHLLGQPKSIIGSSTFLVSSMIILALTFATVGYFADPISMWPVVIMLPLLLACVENLAVFGTDNLALPLVTLYVLSLF
jgi:dolichol kinase